MFVSFSQGKFWQPHVVPRICACRVHLSAHPLTVPSSTSCSSSPQLYKDSACSEDSTYGMEYPFMQRVPKPGLLRRAFKSFCVPVSSGASLLWVYQRDTIRPLSHPGKESKHQMTMTKQFGKMKELAWNNECSMVNMHTHSPTPQMKMYLINVYWSSYIHGCNSRLGYFPKGGTIRLKRRAMQTKTAGRTIWNHKSEWEGAAFRCPEQQWCPLSHIVMGAKVQEQDSNIISMITETSASSFTIQRQWGSTPLMQKHTGKNKMTAVNKILSNANGYVKEVAL